MQGYKWQKEIFQTLGRRRLDGYGGFIKLLNVLKNCDTDLFITLRTEYKIDKNNRHIVTHFPFRNVEYNKIYDISSFNISEHTYGDEFNMHSMTYKTEILRQVNLRHIEGICYTDFQYCFLPIDHIKDFIIFDLYLYYYFIGREEQSTSVQSIRGTYRTFVKVINSMIHHLDSQIHQNPTILANQIHFIDKALNIYVISLRWQRKITEQNYPEIFNVIDAVDRYHIQNRILNKPYFRPWRKLKNPQGTQPNPYFVPLGAYQEIQKDGNVKQTSLQTPPTFPLCRQYTLSKTSEYQSTGKHPRKVPRKKLLKYNR